MKIFVIRVENPEIKIEIKLEEYSLVRNIRNKLDEIFPGRVKWNKHFIKLVHKNIIMDDEKSIGWYKLCEGDEILCVKIENYLCSDDVILEVFLSGFVPEVIYLIVQRNYSISKIKSMIERIQCEIINICDFTGNKMTGSQTVTETSSCAYYRLIVKYGRKETCISTFEDCLKQYHKFRIIHYYDFILRLRHLYECLFETRIDEVIKQMNEIKAIMLSNDPFEIRLKENLSEFPSAFIKCHSIFCDDISSRIWDICDDYWQLSRNVIENDEWFVIRLFFRMALLIVLHQYLEHGRNHCEIATKTFNSIVVDALGYSVTLLIKIRQMESFCETVGYSFDLIGELMEDICVKWMDPFLSTSRYYSEFDEVFNRYYSKTFASLKFGNGSVEFHFHSDPQTIIEAKEAMAQKCGVKVNDLYAIYQRKEDKPTDGEPYDERILDFVLMIKFV